MLERTAVVVSPWLPTEKIPYAGTFVVDAIHYMQNLYRDPPLVVHLDDSFKSSSPAFDRWLTRKLVGRSVRRVGPAGEPRSIHVPLPVRYGTGWGERVSASVSVGAGLGRLGGGDVDVHAHVAMVSGPASLSLAKSSRLILYEHASFVFDVLDGDHAVREIYDQVLQRASMLLCVNPDMAARFTEMFPASSGKIHVHPNPVDFDRFKVERTREEPTRWLYIGSLKPAKGTRRLLKAFRLAMAEFPDISLTVAGRGEDARWLESQELGGRLRILPPVPAAAVPRLMAECDLLVHLSESETFGLTAVEAVASGMPVIVSSTQGSEYVLRPVADEAGEIVPQPATPEDVLAAYKRIRAQPPEVGNARRKLRRWLSPKAVSASLAELLSG